MHDYVTVEHAYLQHARKEEKNKIERQHLEDSQRLHALKKKREEDERREYIAMMEMNKQREEQKEASRKKYFENIHKRMGHQAEKFVNNVIWDQSSHDTQTW